MLRSALVWFALAGVAMASEYHGQIIFDGLPVPGSTVTVTATQGDKKVVAISDDQGIFSFPDLTDGKWSLEILMTGFAPVKREITVAPSAAQGTFELKLMSLDQIRAEVKPLKVDSTQSASLEAPSLASVQPSTLPAGKGAPASGTAGVTLHSNPRIALVYYQSIFGI